MKGYLKGWAYHCKRDNTFLSKTMEVCENHRGMCEQDAQKKAFVVTEMVMSHSGDMHGMDLNNCNSNWCQSKEVNKI